MFSRIIALDTFRNFLRAACATPKLKRARVLAPSLLALLGLQFCAAAFAESFPDRPVKIVVGFAPGSGIDSASRLFAQELGEKFGIRAYVENKPGASGSTAARQVKSSLADGYTILATGMSHSVINPITMKDPGYDAVNDFRIIGGMIKAPFGAVVPANSPFNTIADFVRAARAAGGRTNVGSYSAGYELYTRWFAQEAGAEFNIIPYKGASAQLVDLVGGRLDFAIMDISSVESLVRSKELKLLSVTSDTRLDKFPETPTMKELGYPNYVGYATVTLSVDSRTPSNIAAKLSDALREIVRGEKVKAYAASAGVLPLTDSPQVLETQQKTELKVLGRVARDAGIRPE